MLCGKCLISFLCFDKKPPGSQGNILQRGRLARKLEKLDRTSMEVTHSNLNFIFSFHLATPVDAKEERAIPRFKYTKGITERRVRGEVGHSVTALIGRAVSSSSLLRKWDQEQHGITFAQQATKSYNHGAGRPTPVFYR